MAFVAEVLWSMARNDPGEYVILLPFLRDSMKTKGLVRFVKGLEERCHND